LNLDISNRFKLSIQTRLWFLLGKSESRKNYRTLIFFADMPKYRYRGKIPSKLNACVGFSHQQLDSIIVLSPASSIPTLLYQVHRVFLLIRLQSMHSLWLRDAAGKSLYSFSNSNRENLHGGQLATLPDQLFSLLDLEAMDSG
jgi:hypothetical protein